MKYDWFWQKKLIFLDLKQILESLLQEVFPYKLMHQSHTKFSLYHPHIVPLLIDQIIHSAFVSCGGCFNRNRKTKTLSNNVVSLFGLSFILVSDGFGRGLLWHFSNSFFSFLLETVS